MSILGTARALLALLQPLTGARSTGTATVKAVPGPTATLLANTHAVPIVGKALRFDRLLKVARNPATEDGSWEVAAAGTAIPMISVVGGNDMNLPVDTDLRWWPAQVGIEAKSKLTTAATGAGEPEGLASLKQVSFFEQLRADLNGAPADLFKSMVSDFPSAVLVWEDSGPVDGNAVDMSAQTSARLGRGVFSYQYAWDLFVITSRQDSDPHRREEGLALVDEITRSIQDRTSVDGYVFSNPVGLRVLNRQRYFVSNAFYVYRLQLATVQATQARDNRSFNDWVRTVIDVETTELDPLTIVYQNIVPMP